MGRQSDSNVERTLGHVEPTMGGVMTTGDDDEEGFRVVQGMSDAQD